MQRKITSTVNCPMAPFASVVMKQVQSKAGWQHHFLSVALDAYWGPAGARGSWAGLWPGQRGGPWPHCAALAAIPRWGAPVGSCSVKTGLACSKGRTRVNWWLFSFVQGWLVAGHSIQLSCSCDKGWVHHLPVCTWAQSRDVLHQAVSAQLLQKLVPAWYQPAKDHNHARTTIMQGLEFILY